MATVTYYGTGSRTVFITPKSLANKTATVEGIAATIASQDHSSVTFATAPGWRKAVVITTYETDLETVAEASGASPAFASVTGSPADNAALAAALAAKQAALIAPRTEGATVTLAPTDNPGVSICPVACTVTVPAVGVLGSGFSRGFFGPGVVTFIGAVDDRTPGAAKPGCALISWPDGTFHAVGGKA